MGLTTGSSALIGASFVALAGAGVVLYSWQPGDVASLPSNPKVKQLVLDPPRPGDPDFVAAPELPPVFDEPVYDEYVFVAETPIEWEWEPEPEFRPKPAVQFFGYPEPKVQPAVKADWDAVTEAVTWLALTGNSAGSYGDADVDPVATLVGRTSLALLAMKTRSSTLNVADEVKRAERWLAGQFDGNGALTLKDESYLPLYQLLSTAALQNPSSDEASKVAPNALKHAAGLRKVGGWPAKTGGDADTFATTLVIALPELSSLAYQHAALREEVTRWLLTLDEAQPKPDLWGRTAGGEFARVLRGILLEWAGDRYWVNSEARTTILGKLDTISKELKDSDMLCWWTLSLLAKAVPMAVPQESWFVAMAANLQAAQDKANEPGSWPAIEPFGKVAATALGALTLVNAGKAAEPAAQEPKKGKERDKDDVADPAEPGPQLLGFTSRQGAMVPREGKGAALPLRHTDVKAEISGLVGITHLTQTFTNDNTGPIEAVYCFPLPHRAAVTDFVLVVGARRIRAVVRERQEAEDLYTRAVKLGRTAAIMTRERDGVFNHYVGNIEPGATVNVELTFFEQIKCENGLFEWAFPMVVGPYFCGGEPVVAADNDRVVGHGIEPDTNEVPDASRITPPTLPEGMRSGHDIALTLELEAGFPVATLEVVTHECAIAEFAPSTRTITLSGADSIPNRDFVVRWTVDTTQNKAVVLAHRPDPQQPGWFCVLYAPDFVPDQRDTREITIIMDTSGSMRNVPIDISRRVVTALLETMSPQDRFRIVQFNDTATSLYGPALAESGAVTEAKDAVSWLSGQGGTQMLAGVNFALKCEHEAERKQLYCLLTDGYVGGEKSVINAVKDKAARAEFLTFGIGAAANRALIDGVAEAGNGRAVYVMPRDESAISEAVAAFVDFLANEHLGNLALDWGGLNVTDLAPAGLAPIRSGQMVAVFGRYSIPGKADVKLTRDGSRIETATLAVDLPEAELGNEAIRYLWAARRLRDLEQNSPAEGLEEHVATMTELAVSAGLVSRWTAFVAIDEVGRVSDGNPTTIVQPVELPEGVDRKGVGR
jgi:Ca-activated chloride channel homolog